MLFNLCFKENNELLPYRSHKGLNICKTSTSLNFGTWTWPRLEYSRPPAELPWKRVTIKLNKNIIYSTGCATSLNCILSLGKPFGSIRNSMNEIYPWAISLTPTTFCSLPWRFSFLFFSFFLFFFFHDDIPYCITNVWHCNIVPIDSFSITNIWQGETDFKTLIFHQYLTWNP